MAPRSNPPCIVSLAKSGSHSFSKTKHASLEWVEGLGVDGRAPGAS